MLTCLVGDDRIGLLLAGREEDGVVGIEGIAGCNLIEISRACVSGFKDGMTNGPGSEYDASCKARTVLQWLGSSFTEGHLADKKSQKRRRPS